MMVVGLAGYARSGKDTVADYMVEHHGFTKMSFAAPLKRMLYTLNPMLDAFDYKPMTLAQALIETGGDEDELKSTYPEYRRLMATLGTDCIRALDPNFWINALADQVQEMPKHSRIVISDVRFPNEAEFVKSGVRPDHFMVCPWEYYEGQVWRIHRPGINKDKCAHSSEASIDLITPNRTILNNGTTEDLRELVDMGVETFLGTRYEAAA